MQFALVGRVRSIDLTVQFCCTIQLADAYRKTVCVKYTLNIVDYLGFSQELNYRQELHSVVPAIS